MNQLLKMTIALLATALGVNSVIGGEIRGSVSMPMFYENFDSDRGAVKNSEIDAEIKAAVQRLFSDD